MQNKKSKWKMKKVVDKLIKVWYYPIVVRRKTKIEIET